MSRRMIDRHLQQAQRLLHSLPIDGLDRRSLVVKAALEDERLWYVFKDQREHMRRAALLEAGWNFDWGNTGECGAYAAKWLRQGLVCVGDVPFGEFCDVVKRTATPNTMLDIFKQWGRFVPPVKEALEKVGPGDLIVTTDVSTGHAGIVREVKDGVIHTIEANYSGGINQVTRRDLAVVVGFGSIG